MNQSTVPAHGVRALATRWRELSPERRSRLKTCALAVVLIACAFAKPLLALVRHASSSDLHSHILLIPFVSAYLLALRRNQLPSNYESSPGWALGLAILGMAALALRWNLPALSHNDSLTLTTLGFVSFVAAAGFAILGRRFMAAAAFPFAFLIFMVPLPDLLVDRLENASKLASAEVAHWFFNLTGTPNLRDDAVFQLPTITIRVAQECSGIRSSLVLFITGLLGAQMFLKSPARRLVLVLLVFPLGVLRNGFRILVIGVLCVHVGPHMIHSPIHHRGGPVFFFLSVMVLAATLWWLRRGEVRAPSVAEPDKSR
jgi:exosortase C (VPDSG-CTERM-specific)